MIPLFHDFAGETVLVVGGGSVGARKARRFAREARVVVVSPAFDARFDDAESWGDDVEGEGAGVDLVRAAPTPDSVGEWVRRAEPVLVVAATDDGELNAAVERAAREAGALVNRTDQSGGREAGSVVVPATVRDDPVTVAISTGGGSPALSKHLRERLEDELAGAGAMATLSAEVRADLKARGIAPERRRTAVRAVVRSDTVWKALRTGDSKAGQEAARVIRNELDELDAEDVGNSGGDPSR
ncbi:bifunctional precorrin-2 dehydrogenase/sirohydrochlorin ferrochelatase [Halobium salinum]|uniref:precorrin-2 dehydrogenase n=1 Tax=Halobium salinum TaxID=1364940 RepID=A0ABD5P8T1_9EURY|nr:NAD(P)-dependent oxidoreductase [Halobium salinum]